MTPNEAAFLAGVDPSRIRSWIEAGLIESRPLFPNEQDPSLSLVRAVDLSWASEFEDQVPAIDSSPRGEPARRRARLRGYLQAGLAVVLLLVWVNPIRPSFVSEPTSDDRAGSPVPPIPTDVTLTPPAPDLPPTTIVVRWVGFVRDGDRFDVAAKVANPDPDRWLPAGDASFVFQDASGEVLSTTSVPLSIAPGGEGTVMASGVDLGGVSPDEVASVDLIPSLQPLLPRAQHDPPRIRLTHVSLERTRHSVSATGLLANDDRQRHATIACALRAASGDLAQVASTELAKVRAGRTIPFEVPFRHAEARHGSVTCSILS